MQARDVCIKRNGVGKTEIYKCQKGDGYVHYTLFHTSLASILLSVAGLERFSLLAWGPVGTRPRCSIREPRTNALLRLPASDVLAFLVFVIASPPDRIVLGDPSVWL